MKKMMIMLILLLSFSLSAFADIKKKAVKTETSSDVCPDGTEEGTFWKIVEFDTNDKPVKSTSKNCSGDITVVKYDSEGNPVSETVIGWIPVGLTNGNFKYSENRNNDYLSWELVESTIDESGDTIPVYRVADANCSNLSTVTFSLLNQFASKMMYAENPQISFQFAKLYPNPSKESITIRTFNQIINSNVDIRIYSVDGSQNIEIKDIDTNIGYDADISSLPKGSYMMQIVEKGSKFTIVKTFVKD